MWIVCLDLEGVLTPEIWIEFARASGVQEFSRTTRDEPDYDKLMRYRLDLLSAHKLGLHEIQETIARVDPLPGAVEFLDKLRRITQVVILSDTFSQFALPLMEKLHMPTIFCNELVVGASGRIEGYTLRQKDGKLHAIEGFHSMGFKCIAAGDSFNDLKMIERADKGFLFRTTDALKAAHPDIRVFDEYSDFLAAIKETIN